MIRVAIYSRYSSDLQDEKSIEDQERACRDVAARNGWRVAGVYADRAISGASTANRPDWQRLMRDAESRAFDILLTEDIDRVSRDEADYHDARKKLNFLDVKIYTVHGGEISRIEGGMRALMGAFFLENLAHKVRRGLAGVIHSGRHAGGRAYGYRAIEGQKGMLAIEQSEAAIVTRIFEEFAANESPRAICARLNREKVKPPRGRHWQPSSLNGSRTRGNGILANEIYIGRIVWNKIKMIKNPANGKRVSRRNPPAEWKSTDAPHLRIIDQKLWDRVQTRRPRGAYTQPAFARRPKHLLSGLLRCGSCAASMALRGQDRKGPRVVCNQFKETGTCDHGRNYYVADIEGMVLDGLRSKLLSGPALDRFLDQYRAERKRLAGEGASKRRDLERRLSEIDRRIQRGTAALLDAGGPIKALAIELQSLEAEKERIELDLAGLKEAHSVVSLHPAALDSYRAKIDALATSLRDREKPHAGELREAVRALILRVTVQASKGGEPVTLDIEGRLAQLLTPGAGAARFQFRLIA